MTTDEMLILLKKERPEQTINQVFSFEEIEPGFYSVIVDMETSFFDITIKHSRTILPYPLQKYLSLSREQQFNFRWSE